MVCITGTHTHTYTYTTDNREPSKVPGRCERLCACVSEWDASHVIDKSIFLETPRHFFHPADVTAFVSDSPACGSRRWVIPGELRKDVWGV